MKKVCSFRHIIVWAVVACLIIISFRENENHLSGNLVQQPEQPHDEFETSLPLKNSSSPSFKVVTSLDNRRKCQPDPNQPRSKVEVFPNYANASRFWNDQDKSFEKTPNVVCEFDDMQTASTHFAHSMQQLYGCFSYWQEYSKGRPILILNAKTKKKLERNAFLKGFFSLLKSRINLEIMDKPSWENKNSSVIPQTFNVSGGYILSHTNILNDLVQDEYNLPKANTSYCLHQRKPRIAILNRRKSVGRSIINAELLAEWEQIKNASWNDHIPVEYFEDLDFQEQVSFFQSADILISPHGAQLTGLAFMQAPCSQLIEIFPKGYAIPNFYGSLAVNSNTSYSFLYLSGQSPETEQADNLLDRVKARSTNLCLSKDMVSHTLEQVVGEWQQCCASLTKN